MDTKEFRRRTVAAQIKSAMRELGLNRKQLAEKMGRSPSEVTRWLSGQHNFTLDLLTELSDCLGQPISGFIDLPTGVLEDPAAMRESPHLDIQLPVDAYECLCKKAEKLETTPNAYARRVLLRNAENKELTAMDFCGIWSDMDEEVAKIFENLRSYRTENRTYEL